MAVNAATGEFVWRVPLGVNDAMPEGKRNVGSPGYGGPMVTAGGLVFIGATRDGRFRAFDSRTGKELWSTRFDYNVTAIPDHLHGPQRQTVCRRHGRDRRTGH
jgi:quinoprotein glucose dehydrogenase